MSLRSKRVYEMPSPQDGRRILIDRLWPRGLRREGAAIDDWLPNLAPSHDLRQWFGHDARRWGEFRKRYLAELKEHREEARKLARTARSTTVTLLYAARDQRRNNAVVLNQYVDMLNRRGIGS